MLEVKNLSFKLGQHTLLSDISFNIKAGSFVCVAGANGSGKTLLLKLICGILKPSGGEVLINGKNIAAYNTKERSALMRYQPAAPSIGFDYKVEDIVLMGTNPALDWWGEYTQKNKQAAVDAMRKTNCLTFAKRNISTLSTGEMQRVFIAQTLSSKPLLVLPDEPTSHLDLKQKEEIFKIFAQVASSGGAVICATHDIYLVRKYATHALLLKGGSLGLFAETKDISKEKIEEVYDL